LPPKTMAILESLKRPSYPQAGLQGDTLSQH
jgi:hypothetical protein